MTKKKTGSASPAPGKPRANRNQKAALKPILSREALQQLHPELPIDEMFEEAAKLPEKKSRFSEKAEAQRLVELARALRAEAAHADPKAVLELVRQKQPLADKLGTEFKRHLTHLLAHEVAVWRPLRMPKIKRAASTQGAPAHPRSSQKGQPSSTPSAVQPSLALPVSGAGAAERPLGVPTPRTGGSGGAFTNKSERPAQVQTSDRPYIFNGKFAGLVFKTKNSAVNRFYGAIQDNKPLDEIISRAMAVQRDPSATANLMELHRLDRKIFEDVLQHAGAAR